MSSIRSTITRSAMVAAVVAVTVVLSTGAASAATGDAANLILAEGVNPFDQIVPDFSVFGVEFTKAWQKVLSGAWGLVFVALAFSALRAATEYATARKGGYAQTMAEKSSGLRDALIALGVCTALPFIFAGVIALF